MAAGLRLTYQLITRKESTNLASTWRQCVHVMLYARVPDDTHLFNSKHVPVRYTVMMQMRFDGRLGFPGGFVDDNDDSIEHALYRELSEEMGSLPESLMFTPSDCLITHLLQEKKLCLHFFCKEVSFDEYLQIERRDENQPYHGFEVLGVIRVPLFVMWDKLGGFPSFLRNNFIGNSKDQLITAIRSKNLLSDSELDKFLQYNQRQDKLSDSSDVIEGQKVTEVPK